MFYKMASCVPYGDTEGDIHMRVNCRMTVDEDAKVDTIAFGYLTSSSISDVNHIGKC